MHHFVLYCKDESIQSILFCSRDIPMHCLFFAVELLTDGCFEPTLVLIVSPFFPIRVIYTHLRPEQIRVSLKSDSYSKSTTKCSLADMLGVIICLLVSAEGQCGI